MSGGAVLVAVALLLGTVAVVWIYGERGQLLRPSTRRMMREAGWRRILNLSGLRGYAYGRWPSEYLDVLINHVMPRLGPGGKQWLADRCHGKVLTEDQAEAIISIEQEIPLRDLEQIIPYPAARKLLLKGPPDVAVLECACRRARNSRCEPIQVCMVIGQPPVDFMLEHHPQTSRRLTQAEALELLREEHERGHVHSAWFNDACMDRFYAICNCCKCCCSGIEAMLEHGVPWMASSGYVAVIDEERCAACGTCEECCPFGASHVDGTALVRWRHCMGCGVCIAQCPNDARSLVLDERKGIPLDARVLVQEEAAS